MCPPSIPASADGRVPQQIEPPFEFDLNGRVTISAAAAKMDGVDEFANHYASEWLLWHRSGRLDARMCDIAAFIVSVIGCRFLPNHSQSHKIGWMEKVFLLDKLEEAVPARIADYPAATLAMLRALRPTIRQEGDVPDVGEGDALLRFALPIERMLVLGGDHRLAVDPDTQLNGYGCRPYPRPEAITFSSSTATSISRYAYDRAEKRRQRFIAEAIAGGAETAAAALADEVREGICRQLGMAAGTADVVIAASGTDGFLIAQGLARLVSGRPIVTLIVGVDESGSGVKLALQERHFADDTALSYAVHKGQPLSAGSSRERQIDIPVREPSGEAVPAGILDERVRELAATHVGAGNFVVVHAMNHSKLGYSGPSRALLLELKQRFGPEICIVVDACQMRLDREEIIEYLEHQMIVVITGSKFFTGPPFSGAILLPERWTQTVLASGAKLDAGFNSYCAREDFPPRLRTLLRGNSQGFNLGLLFRWVAALAEMERYYAIPAGIRREAVARFCERVEAILSAVPFIELHSQHSRTERPPGELSGRRMIFPFFLYRMRDGVRTLCSEEQVHQVYVLLNQDCSKRFPYGNAREFRLLAQMCHVGQPVPVRHRSGIGTAVLRISVGARIFSESYSESAGRMVDALIEDEAWQIGVTLAKIALLLGADSLLTA